MRRLMHSLVLAAGLAFPAVGGLAEDKATLVANSVNIAGDQQLIAEGSVEVFFKGQRLQAARIVYDQAADTLSITGPITLTDGKGTVILASQAELSADMTEGLLRSARVVLNEQLQLAAAEVMRVDGRYTAMSRVVASSCKVCEGAPTPLWELRARRVVHDQVEQQLYFDNAQFRFAGVPVFYLPRLRMPDPTLHRASGFLMPSFRTTSTLGAGITVPYFLTLGPHRDLLFSPNLTSKGAATLGLRYRQAYATGAIEVAGALSWDELLPGKTRGYVQAEGHFALPNDFTLTFSTEAVSDDAYLLDYGLPDKDRLSSRLEVSRTRRNEHISARLITFQSLRVGEAGDSLPRLVSDLTYERRFTLGALGGEGGLRLQGHSHARTSTSLVDGDGDGIADGRDLGRLSLRADWRRDWITDSGLIIGVLGYASGDLYGIGQDGLFQGGYTRGHGTLATELRYPLVKAAASGVTHVVEPVLQLAWSPDGAETLPNEDSALVEFDEANLFSLNRYPGSDAVERGIRANLGMNYLRMDPAGWTLGVTVGRVFRTADQGQFTAASGLDGVTSDWMAAWQLQTATGLVLTNRLLLNDDLALTKGELRLGLEQDRFGIQAGYLYMQADAQENRAIDSEELLIDGHLSMGRGWTAQVQNRYDLVADRASRAGFGLEFRNECLSVDLSLSRRFTSSTSVKPTTDFGVSLEILGFGGGSAPGNAGQCRD